ncbi:MAG TPA: DMT family transporter [Candidatus Saccharimonadales bacterium]|nr:DMT family transporter [Candidatus Saccharimonadales bacterium]
MAPIALVLAQNISGAFMAIGLRKLATIVPKAQFQVLAAVFVCMYVLTLPVVLAMGNIHLAALTEHWFLLALAGVTLTLNPVFFYMGLRYMDAAMGSLMATVNIIVAILGAVWLLDERLAVQQVLGAAVVVGAIVYALSVRLSKKQRKHWTWGAGFTLLSGVFLAISMIIQKYLLGFMSGESFVVWGWGMQTALAVLLALTFRRSHFKDIFHKRALPHLIGTGLSKAATAGGFIASLIFFRSLSLAIVLAGLRPLFVSFLGALILKEHEFLQRKIAASVIAGMGVALMFLNV